jgi:hypothetical protein
VPGEQHAAALLVAFTAGAVTARDGLTSLEVLPEASLDEALTQIRSVTGTLEDVTVTKASLEDVFVHLTGLEINSTAPRLTEGAAA